MCGVEFGYEQNWLGGMCLCMSYSFQCFEDVDIGQMLSNLLCYMFKVNVIVFVWCSDWCVGIEVKYISNWLMIVGQVGGYWIVNLILLVVWLVFNLEMLISIYNLFDWCYVDLVGLELLQLFVEQDGCVFCVKFIYIF